MARIPVLSLVDWDEDAERLRSAGVGLAAAKEKASARSEAEAPAIPDQAGGSSMDQSGSAQVAQEA